MEPDNQHIYQASWWFCGSLCFLKMTIAIFPVVTELNLILLAHCTAKSIFWHRVVVKESIAFICRHQARTMGSLSSKDPNSLMVFRKGIFGFVFWPCCVACGILFPWPGIKPEPSAVKVWSSNHWTAREFPQMLLLNQVCQGKTETQSSTTTDYAVSFPHLGKSQGSAHPECNG